MFIQVTFVAKKAKYLCGTLNAFRLCCWLSSIARFFQSLTRVMHMKPALRYCIL